MTFERIVTLPEILAEPRDLVHAPVQEDDEADMAIGEATAGVSLYCGG
jgi:hypothetical protein